MKGLLGGVWVLWVFMSFSQMAWAGTITNPSIDETTQTNQSEIRILVYKAGYLSALGHNHVIYTRQAKGQVQINEVNLQNSKIHISFPVESLIVDDARIRQQEGEDFSSEVSEMDIQATRHNMLTQVFKAKQYPEIVIELTQVLGVAPDLTLDLNVTLNGLTRQVQAPVMIEKRPHSLIASGKFLLKQSNFDIEPLSILLGAIAVKDDLVVKYRFVTPLNQIALNP